MSAATLRRAQIRRALLDGPVLVRDSMIAMFPDLAGLDLPDATAKDRRDLGGVLYTRVHESVTDDPREWLDTLLREGPSPNRHLRLNLDSVLAGTAWTDRVASASRSHAPLSREEVARLVERLPIRGSDR